jgi:hypothetical protein
VNNLGTYSGGIAQQNAEPDLGEASKALQSAIRRLGEASIRCAEAHDNPEVLAHRAEVLSNAAGECASVSYVFKRAAYLAATTK